MKRTTAAGSSGGQYLDYSAGVQPGTLLTAEDRNNLQEEVCNAIEAVGWSLDGTDKYQLLRSIIAMRYEVGAPVDSEVALTPVTVAASKSTANPSFPLYLPIIDRTTADVDVTSAQAPDLVTFFRAAVAKVLGSVSFTATVAGSVLTFANTATNNALIAAIDEDALVSRWLSSGQSATYAASGGDFANGRCINVAGTDYAISAVSRGSRTITVVGTPAAGSQTVIFYPYRIAGSTTSVRLHRLGGFVPVAAGDSDGQYVAGLRVMDTGQGHWHTIGALSGNPPINNGAPGASALGNGVTSTPGQTYSQWMATGASADASNGTPRIAKNTSPRAHSRFFYTWAGRLLA